MLLSKVIEHYQKQLEENGDHHVVCGEEITFNVERLDFDKELGVYKTVEAEADDRYDEVLVVCENCSEWKLRDAVYHLLGPDEDICKECFEADPEFDIFTNNIDEFVATVDGKFKRVAYKRDGILVGEGSE